MNEPTNQTTNQPTNQSNQPANHPTDQLINDDQISFCAKENILKGY